MGLSLILKSFLRGSIKTQIGQLKMETPFMYLGTFKNRGKGPCLTIGFQKMTCIFRGRCGTLECPSSFCVAGAALDVSCCMFYTNRIGRTMSSGDKVQIARQARRGAS